MKILFPLLIFGLFKMNKNCYGFIQRKELLLILSQMLLALAEHYEDQPLDQQTDDYEQPSFRYIYPQYSELFQRYKALIPTPPEITVNVLRTKYLIAKQMIKVVYLRHEGFNGLSVTVIPCTSNVTWSLRYRNQSNIGELEKPLYPEDHLCEYSGSDSKTCSREYSGPGLYTIELMATDQDSYVELYVTNEPDGPKLLQLQRTERTVRFKKRQIENKLSFKWNGSDDEKLKVKYTVVINTRKFYKSICEARSEMELDGPNRHFAYFAPNNTSMATNIHNDIVMKLVNYETNYTLSNVTYGKRYYVNIFALDIEDLYVSYAKGSILYSKPQTLKDGRPVIRNIKSNNGSISFRYKVSKHALTGSENEIILYVIPCGGTVNVEIRHKKKVIVPKFKVDGYRKFSIQNPVRGDRYIIRISVCSTEQLAYFKNVEVFATMRPKLYPLPDLPYPSNVHQLTYSNDCTSAAISWLPAKNNNVTTIRYCIYMEQKYRQENSKNSAAALTTNSNCQMVTQVNQCSLEATTRSKKSKKELTLVECKEVAPSRSNYTKIMTQELKLEPDYDYTVQVIASKKRHRLSYEPLKLRQSQPCLRNIRRALP